jgi:hypothetical protein
VTVAIFCPEFFDGDGDVFGTIDGFIGDSKGALSEKGLDLIVSLLELGFWGKMGTDGG